MVLLVAFKRARASQPQTVAIHSKKQKKTRQARLEFFAASACGALGAPESFRTLKGVEAWVGEANGGGSAKPASCLVLSNPSTGAAVLRLPLAPPLSLAAGGIPAGRLGLTWPRVKLHPAAARDTGVQLMLRDGDPAAAAALKRAVVAAVDAAVAAAAKRRRGLEPHRGQQPVVAKRPRSATGADLTRASLLRAPGPAARIFDRSYFESGGLVRSGGGGGGGGGSGTAEPATTSTTSTPSTEALPPLSPEQAAVLAAILGGTSVYFGGPAGTGKSLVLKHALAALPRHSTAVTAPTALAASALGGTTIHAWAGIGRADDVASAVAAACKPAAAARWRAAAVLVIDEISMLPGSLFDLLDAAGRAARRTPNTPFGGIQIVACGDFGQLPPVAGVGGAPRTWAFQARGWADAIPVCATLKTVHRQAGDPGFIDLLGRLRAGRASVAEIEALRRATARPLPDDDGILPTNLHTHRRDVDAVNAAELEALGGEAVVLTALDEGDPSAWSGGGGGNNNNGPPRSLTLKAGAQVVLTRNLDPAKGLVNGARGVVTGFRGRVSPVPLVRWGNGSTTEVPRARHALTLGGRTLALRLQVPLALGWALSVHRAQGMTLDRVCVRLDGAFEAGMAYVALSRVRSVGGLRMVGGAVPAAALAADPAVVAFYEGLG
jgi:ATP-dependent DNA helicase PIF1